MAFSGKSFDRTVVTSSLFEYLRPLDVSNENLVAQIFPRWNRVAVGAWRPTSLARSDQRERGLAVGYYVNGHNLKLQTDVRRLSEAPDEPADHEVRVQLQVVF